MIPRVYRYSQGPALLALEWEDRFYQLMGRDTDASTGGGLLQILEQRVLDPVSVAEAVGQGLWPEIFGGFPGKFALDTPLLAREVGKVLALGKNFRAHAAEFGEEVPKEPLFFSKLPETLVPSGATVTIPSWYQQRVDHEAELAVVIGREGKEIEPARAMDHVAGYTVANDLTARTLQKEDRAKQFPWFRAKNLDGFLPLGPCFVPRDALGVEQLRLTATVNGELRQDANTADMVVDIAHALAYLSRHLTLHPGDLVLMGTPEGVSPLESGDEVVCAIEGIGSLSTWITRP